MPARSQRMPRFAIALVSALLCPASAADWRALTSGALMLADNYLDQPYCVVGNAASPRPGRIICGITRNSLPEGSEGEHMEMLFSDDPGGATWSAPVRLEPAAGAGGGLTNAYGVVAQSAAGVVYVIYNRNSDNVSHVPNSTARIRDDSLGHFVMRWSADGGESWSPTFLEVPFRSTAIDRNNTWAGAVKMMWSVDQVKFDKLGRSWHGFTKIGRFPYTPPEQSFFLSSNLLTAATPDDVVWSLYPDGDVGVSAPSPSMTWEEAHIVPLESGGFFSVCRTQVGYLAASKTADATGAAGWTPGSFASFWSALPAAAGALLKNSQGPVTLKRFDEFGGRYLLLYYNNAVPGYRNPDGSRPCRNPYWLASGREEAGEVRFSQPEVVLFDIAERLASNASTWAAQGIGYPDMLVAPGSKLLITETNKTHARVHAVDAGLLALLFAQDTLAAAAAGSVLQWTSSAAGRSFPTPPLPDPAAPASAGAGLSLLFWLADHAAAAPNFNETLVDAGAALRLSVIGATRALQLDLHDAAGVTASLATDGVCTARLLTAGPHLAAFTVDTSAHIITASVDGALCDGGALELVGWAWLPANMTVFAPRDTSFVLAEGYHGRVLGGSWYGRALLSSEVIGNFRVGPPAADPSGLPGASRRALRPRALL